MLVADMFCLRLIQLSNKAIMSQLSNKAIMSVGAYNGKES